MSNLIITQLTVGSMQENCYIVSCSETLECIIVDPGDDSQYISEKILSLGHTPVSIVATHGHFDHVMAVLDLQLIFNIPFMMHKKDEFLLERMSETASHFLGHDVVEMKPILNKMLTEGMNISIGKSSLKVIETPGHTPGSVCLYNADESILFVGDLLFKDGAVGRTDFVYGRPLILRDSVNLIMTYPEKTIMYPGHGESTTIADEIVYHRSLPSV
jgi:glyoxylase-like metal-dependent hydrolase (beta-lactamase superfamily II)